MTTQHNNRFLGEAEIKALAPVECNWRVSFNLKGKTLQKKITTWYRPSRGETIDAALEAINYQLPRSASGVVIERV